MGTHEFRTRVCSEVCIAMRVRRMRPHLVVEMIKDAREREELQKLALSQRAHSHLPGDVPLGGLHDERERDAVNARNDGQQAKEVHAVDVLLL
jgi:hypothetical protein